MKGHILQRGRTWSFVIDLGRDAKGKRKQRWYSGYATRREAQAALTRILHELQTGAYVEPARITVAEYLDRWLRDYAQPRVKMRTYERYAEIVTKHLSPALGHHPLARLQPLHIQAYYTEALVSGRRDGRGGLSPQTVLHHHRLLRAALQQGLRWQMIARNVADAVEPPRPVEREMQALDVDGSLRLLETLQGTRYHVPCLLAIVTGLRQGEILGLRWDDLDLDAGTLTVNQALEQTSQGLSFTTPKTRKSRRTLRIPGMLVEVLRQHRGHQSQQRLLLGPDYNEHRLVVTLESGQPWPPKNLSKAFEHLADKAGVPEIRFQDLRHSHASQLLRECGDIQAASRRLGHARTSTTLNIYGHLLPGAEDAAVARLDQARDNAAKRRLEGA